MSEEQKTPDHLIELHHRRQMNSLAQAIDEVFNGKVSPGQERKVGFCLLVFPMNSTEKGKCNYISNGADRKNMTSLFREMAARFEGQPEMSGKA